MRTGFSHRPQEHASYQLHRRERWIQILLPVLFAMLVVVVLSVLAIWTTFRNSGDVSRWTAISTIWLTLPVVVASLFVLATLCVIIYLLSRLTGIIPTYSLRAQRILYRVEGGTKRAAEMTRKPVLFVRGLGSLIKGRIRRVHERI